MSNRQIDFQDVLQLVELIESSANFSEVRLRSGELQIELLRGGRSAMPVLPPASGPSLPAPDQAPSPRAPSTRRETPRPASGEGTTVIKSPMVGTVYRAAEPGASPFAAVGQSVAPGDQLCIVEVMKLMNSISAECHGVIAEILVADGETVEYGQELFVISTR